MRTPTFLLALIVALLATPAVHGAQTPAPTRPPGILLQIAVDELAPDLVATTGMLRTTYAAGATLHLVTGSGPSLHFVESGTLSLTTGDGPPPRVVRAGATGEAATPMAADTGGEVIVVAGDGVLLAPGTSTELRNEGAESATVLELLAAPDATSEVGEGVAQAVLVRQEVPLPQPPVSVTLSRVTLAPGDRLSIPEPPALTFYAAVERSQSFNLSGQGLNRSTDPLDAYVLAIVPATPPA